MGILSKENIKKSLENYFGVLVIILLIIIALNYSFALWCFIGAIIAIIPALFGKDSNSVIQFFCNDSSWKLKLTGFLSSLLGEHIEIILIFSLVVWALLRFTEQGQEILNLLD